MESHLSGYYASFIWLLQSHMPTSFSWSLSLRGGIQSVHFTSRNHSNGRSSSKPGYLYPVSESLRLPVGKTSRWKAQHFILAGMKAGHDSLTNFLAHSPDIPDECPDTSSSKRSLLLKQHQSPKPSEHKLLWWLIWPGSAITRLREKVFILHNSKARMGEK